VEQIVSALRRQLEFGQGFVEKSLHSMNPFTEALPGEKILAALRRQLGWTDALPKKELERKLHEAVRLARARLEAARD
jgi:hypothetical protein